MLWPNSDSISFWNYDKDMTENNAKISFGAQYTNISDYDTSKMIVF